MTASAVCRSGRYGAGWPGRWARSWHAWHARPAGGGADVGDRREQGVLPEVVGLPPGDLIQQVRFGPALEGCRGRHGVLELGVLPAAEGALGAGTARVVPPGAAGRPGWPGTSPARPRRGGGTPRRGRCCPGGAAAQARSPARRCQRRGRARRAGHVGRSRRPREWAASWQAYHDGKAEPPIAGWPRDRPFSSDAACPSRCVVALRVRTAHEPPMSGWQLDACQDAGYLDQGCTCAPCPAVRAALGGIT
jgi:hypothetical protein